MVKVGNLKEKYIEMNECQCLNAVLAGCQTSIFPLLPEKAIDENNEIRDIDLFVNMLDL